MTTKQTIQVRGLFFSAGWHKSSDKKRRMEISMRVSIAIFFFIPLWCASNAIAFPERIHQDYWKQANPLSVAEGGLGGRLTPEQLKSIHAHLDNDHGIKGGAKRHTWSHNPEKVAEWAEKQGMDKKAALNAARNHVVADMAHSGPAGVNGHFWSEEKSTEAEKILSKLENGEPIKRWPDWVEKPGPLSQEKYIVKRFESDELLLKTFCCGTKVVKMVVKGMTIFTFVYEGTKLVNTAMNTEEGLTFEEIVKAAAGIGGVWAGSSAGARLGSCVCAPLNAIEPGGPVCYAICTIGFTVAGGVAGEYMSEKIVVLAFEQNGTALGTIENDNIMRTFIESVGYSFEDPWYWLWLKRVLLAMLGVFVCLLIIGFVKRRMEADTAN